MKKRKYYRKCGICGRRFEQIDGVRNEGSPTGWICGDCCMGLHPEYDEEDYGMYFTAYAYHPAHIDREAWNPCELCEKQRKVFNEDFCGNCGRPLTQEARAELEKRIGDAVNA